MGLSATDLEDADQFASCVQRDSESVDNRLSYLRDRKCEFEKDCCAACQNSRLLGQIIFGVFDDDVRRKLLELGARLSLEKTITIIRTAEATHLQSSNIKQGNKSPVHQINHPLGCQPYGCWSCGAVSRHGKKECPAFGKECHSCHKWGPFPSICSKDSSSPKPETAGSITIPSILQDDMVRLRVTSTCSATESFIQMLQDSEASINAILACLSVSVQGYLIIFSWTQARICHWYSYNNAGPVSSIVGLGQQFQWSGCYIGPRSSRTSAAMDFKSNKKNLECSSPNTLTPVCLQPFPLPSRICGPYMASVSRWKTFQTTWHPCSAPWLLYSAKILSGNGLSNTKWTFKRPGQPCHLHSYPRSIEASTCLHVDAFRLHGVGFILRQQQTDGSWNVVQAGFCFLSDTESRYAMIELECLAAAWAMRKCQQFLEGLPSFRLLTDHRPLIPILNDYFLDKLDNPRIMRLRLSMPRYSFTASWVPGKHNVMADALSCSPIDLPSPTDEIAEGLHSSSERIHLMDIMEESSSAISDVLLSSVSAVSAIDPVMSSFSRNILQGFPNELCNLPLELRLFWQVQSQLYVDEDIILVGPYDISHGHSSPHHPRSNGHVKAAVKSMKKLIAGSWTSGPSTWTSLERVSSSSVMLLSPGVHSRLHFVRSITTAQNPPFQPFASGIAS
ncbi:Uncharacterized protein APZ42_030055 [Daphnia magna]|uniref:Reverse transcriptase RNase H-like domain-containing protein n=1 Tax=Daphnia magna TaxID=35525 RepID=A0A164P3D2_9CRUS|nr:Uncharacterized protein APZ42_030055 [Daphnia magna]